MAGGSRHHHDRDQPTVALSDWLSLDCECVQLIMFDFTFDTALRWEFVGHLAYVFTVLSMLMRSMVALRLFFVCSVLLNLAYVSFWLKDPVSIFWESLLFLVNIGQLFLIWFQNRRARFSEEERSFAASRLRGLSRSETRQLLDCGEWRDLVPGTVLTSQGERPQFLTYLSAGSVGIYVDDQRVASCGCDRYIGEMSVLDRESASATVRVEEMCRAWQLPAHVLDRLAERKPATSAVLEAGIARDMRSKLVDSNINRNSG